MRIHSSKERPHGEELRSLACSQYQLAAYMRPSSGQLAFQLQAGLRMAMASADALTKTHEADGARKPKKDHPGF